MTKARNIANTTLVLGSTTLSLGSTTTSISGLTLSSPTFSGTVSGNLTISGVFTANSDSFINGLKIGRGGSSISSNVAIGDSTLAANTTGTNNVAIGISPLDVNTIGIQNIAIGTSALGSNISGDSNIAIGQIALSSNTTGTQNVAIGVSALQNNKAGGNTAVGTAALGSNTDGVQNVAFGTVALSTNTVNNQNTAIGTFSLQYSTGNGNTALGALSGNAVSSGENNVLLGFNAGFSGTNNLTTGSNNIIIGYNAAATSATVSNQITLGNSSITAFRIPGVSISATTTALTAPSFIRSGGTSSQYLMADGSVSASPVPEIVPLDNLQYQFDGIEQRFLPTYQGDLVAINNPLRLLISLNGIIQTVSFPETTWLSGYTIDGVYVDSDGYLSFTEVPAEGSTFDGRLMAGPNTQSTYNKNYPFRAVDILLGV